MKKVILCALAACTVMLCSCEQKNSSMLTESQAETTTKSTSLTIASQSATATTEFRVTTTTRDPENTVFTSNDGYHTALEGKTEIMEFCKFVVRNWAKVYNGGEDFDFSPYCRYGELAKYLDYTAKHGAKMAKFGEAGQDNLYEMAYYESNGSVKIQAVYSTQEGTQGDFYFVVQSVDGNLVLSDMYFDRMDSIDLIVRPGERFNLEFWAKTGRCDELVKRYEEKEATFTVTVAETNGVKYKSGTVMWKLDNYGSHKFAEGTVDLSKQSSFTVKGTLPYPGFLRLTVRNGKGDFLTPFDPFIERHQKATKPHAREFRV